MNAWEHVLKARDKKWRRLKASLRLLLGAPPASGG